MKQRRALHQVLAILLSLSILQLSTAGYAQQPSSSAGPLRGDSAAASPELRSQMDDNPASPADPLGLAGFPNRPLLPSAAATIRGLMNGSGVDAMRTASVAGIETDPALPEADPAQPDTARTTRGHKIAAWIILGVLGAATAALVVRAANEDDPKLGVRSPTRVVP